MNDGHRRAFGGTDFDAVSGDAPWTWRPAKGASHPARHRPIKCAAKRGDRNRHRFGRAAGRQVRKLLLEALRRNAKFAGQLGVEIAALVNFRNQRFSGRNGALRGEAGALSTLRRLLEVSCSLLQRGALLLQFGDGSTMLGYPLLVDRRQRRNRSHRAREFAQPADVEHHTRVAGAPTPIDIDESSLQIGQLRRALLLESVESCGGLGKRGLRLRHSRIRGLLLFSSNVSLEFELPEIPNQRSSLGREPIGFRLQYSHAIVDAPCHRVRCGAVLSE
jgi:hypothetical protein